MSPMLNLRIPLACVLIYSLFIAGLVTFTTRQTHASNNPLTHSLSPTINESSAETAPQAVAVDEATRVRAHEAYGKLPLSFEENRGQVDKEVKYISRGSGYTLFLTPAEAVLTLRHADQRGRNEKQARDLLDAQSDRAPLQATVLRMKLSGANQSPVVTGEREMGVKTNYFRGNDTGKWQTGVAQFQQVRYAQVYPGIDMLYYGNQQQLEYDFEVVPGGDTSRIALEFEGVKEVKVESGTGDLVLETAGGEVRQHKPFTYQEVGGERLEVESRYVIQGQQRVGIEVGEYDRTQRLVIDPTLSYSTYLGGSNNESVGRSIAVDSSGNVYVTGYTYANDFPAKNEYQTLNGISDAFVTKLNPNLSGAASLLYSTYFGGNSDDYGFGIAVDSSGKVYVTGYTYANDFPTKNEFQTHQGDYDAFVIKLNTSLSGAASLLYSTYLGSSNSVDYGHGIAVDSSGRAYVTGYTLSDDFPTKNQFQTAQGDYDCFVTKLNTNASGAASLLYSTYLGGYSYESGNAIAIDSSGNVYVTGYTASDDFPTKNEYQTYQANIDAFVTKLNPNLSGAASLLYSTLLGGSYSDDYGFGIAVDSSGKVYVTGHTDAYDFPTKNEFQTAQGYYDCFVTKLNTNASGAASLLYSTYLGGSFSDENSYGIAVDSTGKVYVTGYTYSEDFPTLNTYQPFMYGPDVFVTKLDTNISGAAALLYSTYLGGSDRDYGYAIAVDSSGNAYVTGETISPDFPTLNAYQSDFMYTSAFVVKLIRSFTISGRVTNDGTNGISGISITISGSTSRDLVTDDFGYYFAELAVGGNYTITPSSDSGFSFIPSTKSFTNLQANQTDVNFTIRPVNITGKVTLETATGAGLADVTITLTDFSTFTTRTVNTLSDGTYSFTGVPIPGSYSLTPSKPGHYFDPYYIDLNDVRADQTDQNFVAYKLFTISGRVTSNGTNAISGVEMRITGSTFSGATTDNNGNYSIELPSGGDYTLTPSKFGYVFVPSTKSFTNLQANQANVNFTTRPANIGGKITLNTFNGAPFGGVTITLTGEGGFTPRTTTSASDGTYTFTGIPIPGSYTLTPSRINYTFSPGQWVLNNLGSDATGNYFTGTLKKYTITGMVKNGTVGLAGVTVRLTGPTGFSTRSATTSSTGAYTFTLVPGDQSYTVTPVKAGYSFTPTQLVFNTLSANQTGQDFAAINSYTVGGLVKNGTVGLSGVTVTLTSPSPAGFAPRTATTSNTGAYSFPNVPVGRNYTVTPTKTGYQFTPPSKALANLSANQTAVNFLVKLFKITGRITQAGSTTGISAVAVRITSPTLSAFAPLTVQTNSTGYYTSGATLPAGNNYVIEPMKTGLTFNPTTLTITNLNNNIGAGALTNFTGTGP